jgi:hypothetical protein
MHKHAWKRSARKHNRPPRFFVVCECGEQAQAVINHGYLTVFQTSIKALAEFDVKKVRSFRASDREMAMIETGKLSIKVCDGRITLAV